MQLPVSEFLETADFIGTKLCRDAIWSGQRCNWFGVPVRATQRSVELQAESICGPDFYSGTSGIAVFLSRLFAATGERVFRITAEGAIRQALSRLDHVDGGSRIDLYTGLSGVAFSLFEVAENCGIDKFNEMGLLIMEDVAGVDMDAHSNPETVDALLRMYDRHKRDSLLHLAIRVGEELRKQLTEHPDTSHAKHEHLGVASAMLELFKVSGEMKYRHTAEQVLHQNERDVGETNNRVARARLRAFELLREDTFFTHSREVVDKIRSRIDSRLGEDVDFSLAHGLAGDGDLLLEAGRILADDELRITAERIGKKGIESYKENDLPWPCGSTSGWDAPSFMIGTAGIGYFYLRLHDSLGVPSLMLVR